MPECGWLGKREYSKLCDRGRVLLFMTYFHSAAMPECGWLGKREYSFSNVCDRERVLVILEWEHFSFVCDVMILRCDDSDEM
jgi:hypothetical protein